VWARRHPKLSFSQDYEAADVPPDLVSVESRD